jgi:histidinol phosphatase-like PHP family hydrolase
MYKVNLHAHSRYSDGGWTIPDMVKEYKEQGFCCAVVTDHLYSKNEDGDFHYCLNREKYEKCVEDAKKAAIDFDFPVIVGIEATFMRCEEILIFGSKAIDKIFEYWATTKTYLDTNTNEYWTSSAFNKETLIEIRNTLPCATVLCHPALGKIFYENKLWEILDGYERCNSGYDFFYGNEVKTLKRATMPEELKALAEYSNSDAHGHRTLNFGYNYFDTPITNELELITYIRTKKPIKLYCRSWEEK